MKNTTGQSLFIMPYLIDGHNLIGKLPDISLDDPNDEALLIQKLCGFAARTRQKCIVIFDYGIPGGVSSMSTYSVQVIFAPYCSNADYVIMNRIEKTENPEGWTVVSSDHRILDKARYFRMKTIKSAEFSMVMNPPPNSTKPRPDFDEAEDILISEEEIDKWMDIFSNEK